MAKKKYKKKKYTHGGSHNTPTNADKARQFRSMRPAVGENYMYDFSQPSNTQSTHLGQSFEADGKYYAIPSITNNRAPYADNIYHPQSFRQAMDASEGIPFDTQAEASKFAEGSWKLPKYPRPSFEHGGEHDPLVYNADTSNYSTLLPEVELTDNLPLTNQAYLGNLKRTNPVAYAATTAQNSAGVGIAKNTAEWAPVTGEVMDANMMRKDLQEGNYGMAALSGLGFALPFVPGTAIKKAFKKLNPWGKKTPTPDGEILKEVQNFSGNKEVGIGNVSYGETPNLTYTSFLNNPMPGDGDAFLRELARGADKFDDVISRRVGELSTPRGKQRLADMYAPSLPKILNDHKAMQAAETRIKELENVTTYNRLADDFRNSNIVSERSVANTSLMNSSLFNNAAYFRKGPVFTDTGVSHRSEDMLGLGTSHVDNVPTAEHEINHFLQKGDRQVLDAEIGNITPKANIEGSEAGEAYDYFSTGSSNREPTAFAAELRSVLVDKGYMKYADDDYFANITPAQLEDAYKDLTKNPAYRHTTKKSNILRYNNGDPVSISSPQRIFDFMDPTKANFKLLSESLNKLPTAVGAAALGNRVYNKNTELGDSPKSYKYGGQVTNFENGGQHNPFEIAPTTNIGNWAGDNGTNFAPQSPANVPVGEVPHDIESGDYQGELTDFKGWYGDYMLSDKYKERLTSSGDYGSEEEIDALIKQRHDAMQDVTMNVTDKTDPHMGDSSFMKTSDNEMTLNTTRKDPDNKAATIAHEVGHAIGGDYDQYSFEEDKNYRDQKAISPNDIRDLEDRNTIYRNSPNRSINNDNVFENNEFVKDFNLSPTYPTVTTVRQGSPSVKPTKNDPYDGGPTNYDGSPEDYIRNSYTFPEGYTEEAKEKEISRMVGEYEVDNERARNFKSAKDNNSLAKENISKSLSGDYSDLGMKDRIQFQKESYEEDANSIVGSKELKKKYRGMSLEEIPDGVSPEIDSYRDFLKLENEYNTSSKNLKAISKSPYGDTKPREFTPEGGNQQVYKENTQHEIGGSESYSDVVGMRSYLYNNYGISPEDDITPEQYQEIMDDKDAPKHLIPNRFKRKYTTPEDATYILNNIAMEPTQDEGVTSAKYGGQMRKINKYPYGGQKLKYGAGGDFLAGALGGLAGSIPLVGGMAKGLVGNVAEGMGADMESSAASIGSAAGGIGSMAFNPAAGFGSLITGSPALNTNIFKNGGQANVDLEAEAGEVVVGNATVNPNYNGGYATQHGDLPIFTLGGKSHNQGGIGMNVTGKKPVNIFTDSKDIVVPKEFKKYGKGKTFAGIATLMGEELAKISAMEKGDVYDKNTAKRMKPTVMAKFGGLYDAQEKFKEENGFSNPNMGYANIGGPFNGINTDFQIDGGLGLSNDQGLQSTYGSGGYENMPGITNSPTGPLNMTSPTGTTGVTPPTPESGGSNLPWQMYAANAIPGAMNMAKGLFGEAPTMELDRMKEQEYQDFSPILNGYNSSQNRGLALGRAGLEGSGATGAQLRGGYQAMSSNSQANAGQFYNQLAPKMQQSRMETDKYNQGIAQQNQQMGLMEDQFAMQNDPMNSIVTGAEQLVSAGTNLYMDNLKTQNMGTQMYDWMGKFMKNNA